MSDSVRPHRWQPARLRCPWDSPGKNTGVGCHCLLQCMKVKSESEVRLLATPWTAAHQAPPSKGFSRQEYWSGVPLPSPSYILASINRSVKSLCVCKVNHAIGTMFSAFVKHLLLFCQKKLILTDKTIMCVCVLSSLVMSDSLQPHAFQAPLSMGFSRQEYWSQQPVPSPGDLPEPGIKPTSLVSPALAGGFFLPLCHLGSPKAII